LPKRETAALLDAARARARPIGYRTLIGFIDSVSGNIDPNEIYNRFYIYIGVFSLVAVQIDAFNG